MKKKTITLVIYMLVCISLVSVGFAAWIITGGDKTEATGNVVATTVNDESLVISGEGWASQNNSIAFGRPESGYNTGWLQAEAGDAVQNLSVTYSFTLALSDQQSASTIGQAVAKLKAEKVKITLTHSAAIQNAITAKYIEGEKVAYTIAYGDSKSQTGELAITSVSTEITEDFLNDLKEVDAKTATITITISYAWGGNFNNENPYSYYNNASQTGNDMKPNTQVTYKADAKTNLQGLYETLYAQDASRSFELIVQVGVDAPRV